MSIRSRVTDLELKVTDLRQRTVVHSQLQEQLRALEASLKGWVNVGKRKDRQEPEAEAAPAVAVAAGGWGNGLP